MISPGTTQERAKDAPPHQNLWPEKSWGLCPAWAKRCHKNIVKELCIRDTNPNEEGTKMVGPAGGAGTSSNMDLIAV